MKRIQPLQILTILLALNASACEHDHEEGEDHAANNGHVHNNGTTNNGTNNGENNGEVVADALAVASCEQVDVDAHPVTAAATMGALADQEVHAGAPHLITLSEEGAGFVLFHVEEEHQDWSFSFLEAGITAQLTTPEGITLALTGAANASCGDVILVDARQHLDATGEYVLSLEGSGGQEVWFLASNGASDHSEAATNNGHDHMHGE